MDKVTVRARFREVCEKVFSKDGFKFFAKREAYLCKQSFEWQYLAHFRVVKSTITLIEPSFSIRNIPVETIFHQGMKTPKKYIDMTSVLWTDANVLMGEVNEIFFDVKTPEDVDYAAHKYVDIYQRYGKNFFDSFSSLEIIDQILNSNPRDFCPYQPSALHRCCFGVIVAIMCHGRAKAEALISEQREMLAKINNGYYLQNFDNILNQEIIAPEGIYSISGT